MRTETPTSDREIPAPTRRPLRISIRQGMITVAATAVVFALFGVNLVSTAVIAAFAVSALVTKPHVWQAWALVVTAAVVALPFTLLASIYTIAFRAALFLGHWPSYGSPGPKYLPDHFSRKTEFLEFLVPLCISVAVTCFFFTEVMRFATWARRLEFAMLAAFFLWLLAFLFWKADPAGVMEWIFD